MFYYLGITIVLMAVLMLGYFFVQRSLRRVSPEVDEESDVLETRWGCGHCLFRHRAGCLLHGTCKNTSERQRRPVP